MQNEGLFIGLDTVMMTICTGLQTFVHPGIFFPAMTENYIEDGKDVSPPEYKESSSTPSMEVSPERQTGGYGVRYTA